MLDRGDAGGWQIWARIRLAIEALQAPPRAASRIELDEDPVLVVGKVESDALFT
jgi:hypothetical protein